jgi:hypothetical protein
MYSLFDPKIALVHLSGIHLFDSVLGEHFSLTNKHENALFVNPGQPTSKSENGLGMLDFDAREPHFYQTTSDWKA